jgi:SAM-dependent methyltransferase
VYGETPLTSLFHIAKESGLNANDHVIELGCGRGRGVFFLSHWFDCTAEGIEWIPEFVATANQVADCLNNPKVHFICQDMLEADLANATIIYLCGTCLDDLTIRKLVKSLERLARGTKIITVSFPITDYTPAGSFVPIKQFNVKFPWGETEIFLYKKI